MVRRPGWRARSIGSGLLLGFGQQIQVVRAIPTSERFLVTREARYLDPAFAFVIRALKQREELLPSIHDWLKVGLRERGPLVVVH